MRDTYLVFGQPCIEEPEIEEVVKSMRAAWLGTGPKVLEFERLVGEYKGSTYAAAVSSCTAGLHLSCLALGIGPDHEVIVPAMTFCATVNAIIHCGGMPVLVDVEPDTFNMDPAKVRKAISSKTKAIIPVHFAGRACNMDALGSIAKEYNLKIIEDCAHAFETDFHGRRAGTIGDCGVLSFYSTKNVVTGEGGIVLTDNPQLAARIKVLALHGLSRDAWRRFSDGGYKHYQVVEVGYKYNMIDLQAAIGMHQVRRVDAYWQKRLAVWERYNREFADLPLSLPAPIESHSRHGLHLYTILVDQERVGIARDDFLAALHRRNIGAGVHYLAIPSHPVYQDRFGWMPAAFPIAKAIGETTISLPLSAKLTERDVSDVVDAVRDIVSLRR